MKIRSLREMMLVTSRLIPAGATHIPLFGRHQYEMVVAFAAICKDRVVAYSVGIRGRL